MKAKKVDIVLNPVGARCKVLMDGEEISNCRAVTVRARVGKPTFVSFELFNCEVTVTGETGVKTKLVDVTDLAACNRYYKKVREAEAS